MPKQPSKKRFVLFSILAPLLFLITPAANTYATSVDPFPIGIFYNPSAADSTNARYAEIADMNATFIVGTNYVDTFEENDKVLDLAAANGLKVLVKDGRFEWNSKEMLEQEAAGGSLDVSSSSSLGQTFESPDMGANLGLSTIQLRINPAMLSSTAELTLTLYDEVSKIGGPYVSDTVTGPFTSEYLTFDFYASIAPNHIYYMELTSNSTTALPFITSGSDAYTPGQAYQNGAAQSSDLWFNVDFSTRAYFDGQRPSDTILDEIALHYKDHPGLLGYNIIDEPQGGNTFSLIKEVQDRLKVSDPNHMSFINLTGTWPNWLNYTGIDEFSGEFVTPSQSLGQTFKTRPDQTQVNFIEIWTDASMWTADESLTMSLWDSPAKNTLLAAKTMLGGPAKIFFDFELNAAVTPDTTYYWELTHNGGADNSVGWVIHSKVGGDWVPDGTGYVNGSPINADFYFTDSISAYENHVKEWVSKSPDVLSFDHYPFDSSNGFSAKYFDNIELIRQESLEGNVNFWAYVQSVGLDNGMRAPTESEMRFNMYTQLAYGAKGLIYFTYWTPPGSWGFHDGLILQDGTQNVSYTWAKNLNAEVLKLGPTLKDLTSQAVYHTGTLPESAVALPSDFFMQPTDSTQPLVIGYFKDQDEREYVFIVNRDYTNSRTVTFSLPSKPDSVKEVSKTTGLDIPASYDNTSGILSASFAAGEGRLYALDVPINDMNVTSLTTEASTVSAGTTFKVKYGLDSVSQDVYAQDIMLQYDSAVVEFVSAKSIKTGVSLLETVREPAGSLQLILASEGPGNELKGQADIVELTFKAKYVSQVASSEIQITSATLAGGDGAEYSAALSSVNVQVTLGISGDFNNDHKVTIGDLAIMAAHYGKDANSADWEQVKRVDLNGDGKIDIDDLVAFAKKVTR
ncbi:cohesin domain-containing protein [Paenibacillus eucommiae]|uniref:Dockerin domain-containing protein n=1 Tax=Paenibacillus eucommiae TaxID=1355755 RepID=A0ABS4IWF0_9BACL|nr:cohesin domain-containing protein [Paenibacillus eucommiae]MBP1991890.1 hypothetical protein [Paenibacillus eucommiae]